MSVHETFIRRCFQLAKLGKGAVAPNPFVGAVIVHDGKVIGEGYHRKYGGPHAEVNAIQSVTDKGLLSEATVYVNLEPCSFTGNTPPCADLLVHHQVKRVVISNVDPHERVSGTGIERLRQAGIDVVTDVLSEEGAELNRRFFAFHQKKRPYIILKWAQSQDGYLDLRRQPGVKGINWVSTKEAKLLTHLWRSEEAAILVGRKTVEVDNPTLTVREVSGNNPTRIVLDPNDSLSRDYHVFDESARTLIYNHKKKSEKDRSVNVLTENYLHGVLENLYQE
ncbi:MAG: bifunctional diaminohydroxyphosphoribosylaminopyrimidine deaminase/5-amino-6-(5-phosphoribosylamino)uracil reductase RibD, partial [Flavobacteriales bacterium]